MKIIKPRFYFGFPGGLWGELNIMGHISLRGLITNATVLGENFIIIKEPIFDFTYESLEKGSCYAEILKMSSGKFHKTKMFTKNAIHSIIELDREECITEYNDRVYSARDNDLPF